MTVNHPQFGLMCEMCFAGLTPEQCAVDTNGDKWDVCRGECARQAGITEAVDHIAVIVAAAPPVDEQTTATLRRILHPEG